MSPKPGIRTILGKIPYLNRKTEQTLFSATEPYWETRKIPENDPFLKKMGAYASLYDFRSPNDLEILSRKLSVPKDGIRHVKEVLTFKLVGNEYPRINVFGTVYSVDSKEYLVTFNDDVLEVGSESYQSFMKNEATWGGLPFEEKFHKVPRVKTFMVPRSASVIEMYGALLQKMSDGLSLD